MVQTRKKWFQWKKQFDLRQNGSNGKNGSSGKNGSNWDKMVQTEKNSLNQETMVQTEKNSLNQETMVQTEKNSLNQEKMTMHGSNRLHIGNVTVRTGTLRLLSGMHARQAPSASSEVSRLRHHPQVEPTQRMGDVRALMIRLRLQLECEPCARSIIRGGIRLGGIRASGRREEAVEGKGARRRGASRSTKGRGKVRYTPMPPVHERHPSALPPRCSLIPFPLLRPRRPLHSAYAYRSKKDRLSFSLIPRLWHHGIRRPPRYERRERAYNHDHDSPVCGSTRSRARLRASGLGGALLGRVLVLEVEGGGGEKGMGGGMRDTAASARSLDAPDIHYNLTLSWGAFVLRPCPTPRVGQIAPLLLRLPSSPASTLDHFCPAPRCSAYAYNPKPTTSQGRLPADGTMREKLVAGGVVERERVDRVEVKLGYVAKIGQRRVRVRGPRPCEGDMHDEQVRVDRVEVGEGAEHVYARMVKVRRVRVPKTVCPKARRVMDYECALHPHRRTRA
ncbi:hypothetical protein DFH08DRAFT_940179 [Mycena albidolilacea]|uniref:Uncharacterized protein n=1 Tax=Mycena albidolilacea TaxID=1033008 RepID=A0AAD7EL25_9AGAR|nr:hypothetical protein DFH08DRAFT_940179 [Mycena albidolilacea]